MTEAYGWPERHHLIQLLIEIEPMLKAYAKAMNDAGDVPNRLLVAHLLSDIEEVTG